jgi:ornithine--oxo-acid transaminase
LSTGSLALNGANFFRERFGPLMPSTDAVPFNDIAALEQALRTRDVAAFKRNSGVSKADKAP